MIFTKRPVPKAAPPPPGPRVLARGERVILREFERGDVDRWMAWPRHSDPLFDTYNAPRLNDRQRDTYYRQYREAPDARQFSVDAPGCPLVGRISLREIDWRLGAAVLGVSFNPEKLNQGYGSDALWAFLGYYFGPLKMRTLFLDVAAFNRRAYRVYEKCGFHRCGQRWGEPQTDTPGIFRRAEYESIRSLFRWEHGLMRPLLIDMVIRRDEWERLWRERMAGSAPGRRA